MKRIIFVLIIFGVNNILISQNCIGIETKIDLDYSYQNKQEGLSIFFNKNWEIVMENQNGILVAFAEINQLGTLTIIKNKNQFNINSAHDFTNIMVSDYLKLISNNTNLKAKTNTYLHNIKALQLEYVYSVQNLDEIKNIEGMSFLIAKDDFTFFFLFNCEPSKRECFFPLYKEIMKNIIFNQLWF